jgi:hypothetical protein
MTIRRKLTVAALITSAAAAVALFLSPVPKAQAQGQGHSVTLSGTIYGSLDFVQGAWVGHVRLSFDNQDAVTATFIDSNDSMVPGKNGIDGTETILVDFGEGHSFKILGRFASNALTPGLFSFHETGAIAYGTGKYANASGQVSIQGLAAGMPPSPDGGVPMWISEIHGVMLGVK